MHVNEAPAPAAVRLAEHACLCLTGFLSFDSACAVHHQVVEIPVPAALQADMETRRAELVERISEVGMLCAMLCHVPCCAVSRLTAPCIAAGTS